MKVAVCLVVQNEAVEIIYWIAWYRTLGFDSFIIYNDNSSDATESVILSLQNVVDIRYMRNAENLDMHAVRQVRCYNDAVVRYGKEFDWIALFDGDEYLDLYGKNIHDYLEEYDETVSSVAFNWCCVGTNGFVARPEGPPFLNYTRHGKNDLSQNRHTKIIFRPTHLSQQITHVHNVYVTGKCVASDGNEINWSDEYGGYTNNIPTWEKGRLIHYQSRSIEHYVKRHKNLEVFRSHLNDPLHVITNSNEFNIIESQLDSEYIKKFYEIMNSLVLHQSYYFIEILKSTANDLFVSLKELVSSKCNNIFDPSFTPEKFDIDQKWISFYKQPGNMFTEALDENVFAFSITNFFKKKLCVRDGYLSVSEDIEDTNIEIIGVYVKGSNVVHLFPTKDIPFLVSGDVRINNAYTYTVWKNSNNTFSMSHPRTKRFMSFEPNGFCSLNRQRAFEWEIFSYETIALNTLPDHILKAIMYLSSANNLQTMKDYFLLTSDHNKFVVNAINSLSECEFKVFNLLVHNTINEHIY